MYVIYCYILYINGVHVIYILYLNGVHVSARERCRVVWLVVQSVNLDMNHEGYLWVVIYHFFDASIPVCRGTFQGQESRWSSMGALHDAWHGSGGSLKVWDWIYPKCISKVELKLDPLKIEIGSLKEESTWWETPFDTHFKNSSPVVSDQEGKHQVHHWSLRERLEIRCIHLTTLMILLWTNLPLANLILHWNF